MFDITLKIIILLSVLIPYGNDQTITDGKLILVGTFCLFIASVFNKFDRWFHDRTKYFLSIAVGLFLLSDFIHGGVSNDVLSLQSTIYICACISAFLVIKHTEDFRAVSNFILIGIAINLTVFLIEYSGVYKMLSMSRNINPLFFKPGKTYANDPGACLGNMTNFTTYLACLIPIIYNRNIMNIPIGKILTGLFCLIACFGYSDPQMIVLLVTFVSIYLNCDTKAYRLFILPISIPVIFFFRETIALSIFHRFETWLIPYYDFKVALFTKGISLGYYPYITNMNQIGTFLSSHVLLIFQLGVGLSFILYAAFFISHRKHIKAFIPYLVIALFEFPLEIKRLWFLLIFNYSNIIVEGENV